MNSCFGSTSGWMWILRNVTASGPSVTCTLRAARISSTPCGSSTRIRWRIWCRSFAARIITFPESPAWWRRSARTTVRKSATTTAPPTTTSRTLPGSLHRRWKRTCAT
uniref:(northern house mosquito) hypothetical protein n=1 Tax=Culex pipiens TaxID=7175 RepID=A0A8D8IKM8_CULPI